MNNAAYDPRYRTLALTWLALAAGMVNWGDLVLRPVLQGWFGAAYWGACLGVAALAVTNGLRDIRWLRDSQDLERIALVRRTYRDLLRLRQD